jgi:lipoprotein-releasing system permease protein
VIGERLAQSLGLGVGDRITLISPRGPATPFGVAPRSKSYEIVATFLIGMAEYDSSFVFLPLEEAQRFFGLDNGVSAIEVMTAAPERIERFRQPVLQAAGPGVAVTDWRQLNESFFNALAVERNVMFLILTLIILVAAFNIISGLVMLVKDKGSDIAILRTMGASGGAVLRIFFIAGASIGLVGTLTGLIIGTLFCLNIEGLRQFISRLTGTELFSPEVYFLSQLPADMDPHEVGMVVAMALGLSFLATLYPAWRAARLDPVEALRHG